MNWALVTLIVSALLASNGTLAALTPTVAILQFAEHPALQETKNGIEDGLKNKSVKIAYQNAQGNPSLAAQIAQQFIGHQANVLVGIGTSASQSLIAATQHQETPIVFSSVTNPAESKLIHKQVTGVSNYLKPQQQFHFFKKILPSLSRLGIVYNPGETNSIALNREMAKVAPQFNINLIFIPTVSSADVPLAMQAFMQKVDAIFINNDNTAHAAIDSIVKIANQNFKPVLSSDTATLSHGVLAALGVNQYELGKTTAVIILKILQGQKPEEIPYETENQIEAYLNESQMKKLNITIDEELKKTVKWYGIAQ